MVERVEVRAQVVAPLEVDGAQLAAERRLARVRPLVHRQVRPPTEHPAIGNSVRGLPDMMSAWKSGHSKGGCVNSVYKSVPNADKRRGV